MLDAATAQSAPAVVVRGETRCPRPDDVAATLGRMLALPAPGASQDVAELREERSEIVVVLRRAGGEILGERRVPASLTCAARAEVVAVAVAALEAQVTSGEVSPLEVTPPSAASGNGAVTSDPSAAPVPTPPAPDRAEAPPGPPLPARDDRSAPVVAARAANERALAPARARWEWGIGAGAYMGTDGRDVAPAGRVELVARRAPSAWSICGAVAIVGTHEIAVGSGQGAWWRVGGELALARSVVARAAALEVRAGFALAALSVEGRSFSKNDGATLLDPGAVAGVRLAGPSARLRTWVDLSVSVWPRSHGLSVVGADTRVTIPAAEGLLGLGMSFGPSR